ncbi:MAG: LysR substrate-binding domain-containing protein [Pseudomonadota bacterium]
MPMLPSCRREHPGIALLVDTNDSLVDLYTSEVDVTLPFGEPSWDGLHHEPIKREELIVVIGKGPVGTSASA